MLLILGSGVIRRVPMVYAFDLEHDDNMSMVYTLTLHPYENVAPA